MSPLSEYIARARKKKGWDRMALSVKTGVPYSTLRHIELAPHTVRTSEQNLRKIADALDVSFDELRVLAGYLINSSTSDEAAAQKLTAQLEAYPELKKAITTLLDRGDRAEIDRAATVLEVHRRVEQSRGKR